MGYSTEVKAVLGIDTSKMPEDARKAIEAFKKAAQEIEQNAAKGGASAGAKFTDGLSKKILDARSLGTTLATALGINLPALADKVAAAISGGSAEGWKKSVEIAERNAEVIEKIIESHMNPAQLQEKLRKDLQRAIKESGEKPAVEGPGVVEMLLGSNPMTMGMVGGAKAALGNAGIVGTSEAERAEEAAKKKLKVDEADLRVQLEEKKTRDELKRIEESAASAAERRGTLSEREVAIRKNINTLLLSMARDDLTAVEMAQKKADLAQKEADLKENAKDQAKEALEAEKTALALEEKRTQLKQQQVELEKDKDKLTDRGKLTVGELATLRAQDPAAAARADEARRSRAFAFGEDAGLSAEARAAKDKAQRVKDLEAEAEQARLGGDSGKATDLLGQVGTLRDELVKSGFTKSTEGDPAKALREQIAKDNAQIIKTLNDISTTEKGKFVNQ